MNNNEKYSKIPESEDALLYKIDIDKDHEEYRVIDNKKLIEVYNEYLKNNVIDDLADKIATSGFSVDDVFSVNGPIFYMNKPVRIKYNNEKPFIRTIKTFISNTRRLSRLNSFLFSKNKKEEYKQKVKNDLINRLNELPKDKFVLKNFVSKILINCGMSESINNINIDSCVITSFVFDKKNNQIVENNFDGKKLYINKDYVNENNREEFYKFINAINATNRNHAIGRCATQEVISGLFEQKNKNFNDNKIFYHLNSNEMPLSLENNYTRLSTQKRVNKYFDIIRQAAINNKDLRYICAGCEGHAFLIEIERIYDQNEKEKLKLHFYDPSSGFIKKDNYEKLLKAAKYINVDKKGKAIEPEIELDNINDALNIEMKRTQGNDGFCTYNTQGYLKTFINRDEYNKRQLDKLNHDQLNDIMGKIKDEFEFSHRVADSIFERKKQDIEKNQNIDDIENIVRTSIDDFFSSNNLTNKELLNIIKKHDKKLGFEIFFDDIISFSKFSNNFGNQREILYNNFVEKFKKNKYNIEFAKKYINTIKEIQLEILDKKNEEKINDHNTQFNTYIKNHGNSDETIKKFLFEHINDYNEIYNGAINYYLERTNNPDCQLLTNDEVDYNKATNILLVSSGLEQLTIEDFETNENDNQIRSNTDIKLSYKNVGKMVFRASLGDSKAKQLINSINNEKLKNNLNKIVEILNAELNGKFLPITERVGKKYYASGALRYSYIAGLQTKANSDLLREQKENNEFKKQLENNILLINNENKHLFHVLKLKIDKNNDNFEKLQIDFYNNYTKNYFAYKQNKITKKQFEDRSNIDLEKINKFKQTFSDEFDKNIENISNSDDFNYDKNCIKSEIIKRLSAIKKTDESINQYMDQYEKIVQNSKIEMAETLKKDNILYFDSNIDKMKEKILEIRDIPNNKKDMKKFEKLIKEQRNKKGIDEIVVSSE